MRGKPNRVILVIDDDLVIVKLFAQILTKGGYAVLTASSGQIAYHILQREPLDLVVLDLDMPPPDGFEILKALRSKPKAPKVVVVSGFVDGALLQASELFGATTSLRKTDAPTNLLAIVNQLLGR